MNLVITSVSEYDVFQCIYQQNPSSAWTSGILSWQAIMSTSNIIMCAICWWNFHVPPTKHRIEVFLKIFLKNNLYSNIVVVVCATSVIRDFDSYTWCIFFWLWFSTHKSFFTVSCFQEWSHYSRVISKKWRDWPLHTQKKIVNVFWWKSGSKLRITKESSSVRK